MVLTLNVTDKVFLSQKRGRLNYEFDCYIPHWRGIRLESVSSGKVTDVLRIDNSTEDDVGNILAREGDRLGDIRYDQWNKVKVVFDYANSAAEYYLNSEYIGIRSFQDYENMDTDALRYMRIVSFAPQNTILYFDNFNIWYEEYPNVSQIRYVDSRGRETAGEEVNADLAEIRIEFNCSMDVESLDKAVVLENSDGAELFSGSFDEASNTYTLKPTNGKKYFLPNMDYTLTIDTSAASGGIPLRSPVIYCFHTGQGVVRIDQFDVKNMDGKAVNAAKVSGNEVKVIAQALNSYEEGKNIQMILCGYKENLLTYMQSWKVPLRMGETYISKRFQVEENAEIDTVKAFVWDSVGRALPLRECVVVTK